MVEHRFNLKQISENVARIQDQEACIVAIINQCRLLLYVIDRIRVKTNDEISLVLHECENVSEWNSTRFQSTKSNIFASLGSVINIGKGILDGRFEDSDYLKLALRFITGLLMNLGHVKNTFSNEVSGKWLNEDPEEADKEMSLEQGKIQLLYNFDALASIIPFCRFSIMRNPIEVDFWIDADKRIRVKLIEHAIGNIYSSRLGWMKECEEEQNHPELSIIPGPYDEIVVEK